MNCKYCVSLFYRPPSSSVDIFDRLAIALDPMVFSSFVLLGDSMHSLSLFSLTQIVMSATHDNPNGSSSLIDLVFLSSQSSCNIIPPLSNSDHKGLMIELLKPSTTLQRTRHPRTVWNYAKADFNKARYLINSTNWELMSEDVNVSLTL